jgi:hypothetical protein
MWCEEVLDIITRLSGAGGCPASTCTTVILTLNAAALAAIGVAQGGNLFVGGIRFSPYQVSVSRTDESKFR